MGLINEMVDNGFYRYRFIGVDSYGDKVYGTSKDFSNHGERMRYMREGLQRFYDRRELSDLVSLESIELFLIQRIGVMNNDGVRRVDDIILADNAQKIRDENLKFDFDLPPVEGLDEGK